MSFVRLHLLTERLSSLLRGNLRKVASQYGLNVVQLEALVYFSAANRYSDTPKALTEYFGVTKGTISQTIKVLEREGLIRKYTDTLDGRVQHCAVTRRGMAIVKKAYPADCFTSLSDSAADSFTELLQDQLHLLQLAAGSKSFGQCYTCRFFKRRQGDSAQCGLTGEKLSVEDRQKICREHENKDTA